MNSGHAAQMMANQTPCFDRKTKKKRRKNENQVVSKSGIIRPDRRHKVRYL